MQRLIGKENLKIKIIGDSIAAGIGSTRSFETDQLVFEDTKKYFRCVSPNSWWGLLESYLHGINPTLAVVNNGCGGAYSYQIKKHLDTLVSQEDDIVFVLLGLNDRKRPDGLKELKENLENIIERLISWGKIIVILTPNPSVHRNEYYQNRIHHTDQIVEILKEGAENQGVFLIDNYQFLLDYLAERGQIIDDIIFNTDGTGDGLHPGDFVQKLMFENIISKLGIQR